MLKGLLQGQAMIVMMQAPLALIFAGVICYLYIAGRPVPVDLVNVLLIIIGFFFGEGEGGEEVEVGWRELVKHGDSCNDGWVAPSRLGAVPKVLG